MAAPTISSRTPSVNETEVYLNQLIYVTFNQDVDSDTLTDNTVLLYRTSDYELIGKTIEYDSSTYKMTVTPSVAFNENTTYNIVVVGADQSSTCVKTPGGESLATTATWYFTTGTEVYDPPEDTQPETQPDEETSEDPVTRVLEPPSSTNLAIISTYPEQYATNLGTIGSDDASVTWPGPITVKFNKQVASGVAVDQDWISLEVESVDGDPSTTTALPSGTLSNTVGKTLTWTPANTDGWAINNEVIITISEDVQDIDGNTLDADYQFMFSTAYRPYYCTVKKIRAAIGPFLRDITDEAIGRNIYLNSLEIYNIANTVYDQDQWDMDSPTFAAQMWTCCKTQYDLLYAKLLDMGSSGAGQMKRLGDLSIQESSNIQDGIKGAINKALNCMNAWFKQVLGKYRRAKSKMVVKGVASSVTPPIRGVRTWAAPGASESPGANKRIERELKSPGAYDDWA